MADGSGSECNVNNIKNGVIDIVRQYAKLHDKYEILVEVKDLR